MPENARRREELDAAFSPSRLVPDVDDILAEYRRRSRRAQHSADPATYSYGDHPQELLDYFPPPVAGAPVHVFVHGGHWQELSKQESSFAALDFLRQGCGFAAVGYGLAPARRLDEMVDAVWRALCWLRDHAEELGSRPQAVHASGSSAGAHLLAMALCLDARRPADRPDIASSCLISGTYDLEPIRDSYVNDALGLDAAQARELSPLHSLPCRTPEIVLARGEVETAEYVRQHDGFRQAARKAGNNVRELVVAGANHFDVVFGLGDPEHPLGRVVRECMVTSGH